MEVIITKRLRPPLCLFFFNLFFFQFRTLANAGLLDKMGKLCSCLFSISVLDQRVNDVTDFIKKCITSEAFRQLVIELCFSISCWQPETITFLFYFIFYC